MKLKNKNFNKGFVILFAVTIASLLLAIALGVSNIALREMKFSTNARDTNDAFFSADTGAECALFYDNSDQSKNAFEGGVGMNCAGNNGITITKDPTSKFWSFVVSGLGSEGQSCAKVTVDRTDTSDPIEYFVIAKGYNNGGGAAGVCDPGANAVEREVKITY